VTDIEAHPNSTKLSRRRALKAFLSAAAAPSLVVTELPASMARIEPDPALLAWRAWRSAHCHALSLCRKQQRLESELARTVGFPSTVVKAPELSQPTLVVSMAQFDRIAEATPAINRLRAQVADEIAAHQARWDARDHLIGYSATRREEDAASAEEERLSEVLFTADASSFLGVIAKLDALIAMGAPAEASREFPWPQLRKMRVDLTQILRKTHDFVTA